MINKITSGQQLTSITANTRLLVKKDGIYTEDTKPNILKKIWRQIKGQYNTTKIAQKAVELFQNQVFFRLPDKKDIFN